MTFKQNGSLTISPVEDDTSIGLIALLAAEIWREHYTPIIGIEQVNYMIDRFQSEKAMKEQMANGYAYYSLQSGGHLIGYYAIELRGQELFLSKFYLQRSERGKGYGRQAFQKIINTARTLGAQRISLTVNKYNTATINAYKALGFRIVEEVVFDIGSGFVMDDYRMHYDL